MENLLHANLGLWGHSGEPDRQPALLKSLKTMVSTLELLIIG